MKLFHAAMVLVLFASLLEADEKTNKSEVTLSKKWTTLLLIGPRDKAEKDIPDDFPIQSVEELELAGPHPGHPHLLGDFKIDGRYRFRGGLLRREGGNSALLRLPPASSFDIEGLVQVGGIGGWIMLIGWEETHGSGYCIYQTQTKVSGAPWHICEFKDGKVVEGSDLELTRQEVSGEGPLRISMAEKKLSLELAGVDIFKGQELPNYEPGCIMLGTFGPRYGPKDISFKSLRMRLR